MAAPKLSFARKLAFSAIVAGLLAILLFGGLELVLRAAHYGYSPHFARRARLPDGASGWRENRWATAPYFSEALVRRPQPLRLPAHKPPGTYRIFVLGSSAAMGDPEPSFSPARMLEKMLAAAYPGTRIEVVNAAITAINSHVVRGIAADCVRLEPDLFIVYEGHNEVIGPFGPAGVFTGFVRSEPALRALVRLKTLRTGQFASAVGRRLAGQVAAPADWGGMQMFLQQQIAVDDPRLDTVRAHFRANLLEIGRSGRRAGARTLVCTTATNRRDFAPFASLHRAGLNPGDLARWDAAMQQAQEAQRAGDAAGAEAAYRAALSIDDRPAELAFRLGRLLLGQGRDAEAREFLERAVDLDALRFRADRALNDVVRDLASGAPEELELVDLARRLDERSAHGIAGDDLLYEHVHLTFRGTYELAVALFERVSADLQRRQRIAAPAAPFTYDEARVQMGYTVHEQAMIALELIRRFQAAPFTAQIDHAFRLRAWEQRAEAANTLLARPDAAPSLRAVYDQALQHSPDDWILARNAGAMLVSRQAPGDALPLLERAAAWIDDDVDTLVPLGWAHRALGHAVEAKACFARVHALEPRYPGLPTGP